MKTEAGINPLHYATIEVAEAYSPLMGMKFGHQIWNLMWLSFDFSRAGYAQIPNQKAIQTLTHTVWCDNRTGELLNPYVSPYERMVAFILDQPPEVFVDWLNQLPAEALTRLPTTALLGSDAWLAKVNQRLPLCNKLYDSVSDTSQAQELLSKF